MDKIGHKRCSKWVAALELILGQQLRASLAEPLKTRTEKVEFSSPNSRIQVVKWLAQNRARKPKL
jgi:hypothetical protein